MQHDDARYSDIGSASDVSDLPLNASFRFEDSGWNGTTAIGVIRESWCESYPTFFFWYAMCSVADDASRRVRLTCYYFIRHYTSAPQVQVAPFIYLFFIV